MWCLRSTGAPRARRPSADLALILGTLAAACLVLASATPQLLAVSRARRELVVVIDNGTASLSRGRSGLTRIEEAAAKARELVKELEPGARAALVTTSPAPRLAVPLADDPSAVARAADGVRGVERTGPLSEAVSLALALGKGRAEVVVLTSRALPPAPPNVRRVPVGEPGRNLAMTHADFSATEVFVSLRSFSDAEVTADLSLGLAGETRGPLAEARGVRVPAGGNLGVVMVPERANAGALASADALELSLDVNDDLQVDNTVRAARMPGGARRVGVVGRPSEALARALWAAHAEAVAVEEYTPESGLDMLVYVGETPRRMPLIPALFVAPRGQVGPVRLLSDELRGVKGIYVETEEPAEGVADAGASLVRGFPPVEVAVGRASRARIFGPHRPALVAGNEVLAATFTEAGVRYVYLGFRPEDSDWPSRASFPVFVARVLASVRAGPQGPLAFARTGDVPAAILGPGVGELVNERTGRRVPGDLPVWESGLYRAGGRALAVNLLSERESDNRLAPWTGSPPDAAAVRDASARRVTPHELAGLLSAVATALLAVEWLVSARRS